MVMPVSLDVIDFKEEVVESIVYALEDAADCDYEVTNLMIPVDTSLNTFIVDVTDPKGNSAKVTIEFS